MVIKLEKCQPGPPKGRYVILEGSTNAEIISEPHKLSEKGFHGLISNAQESFRIQIYKTE